MMSIFRASIRRVQINLSHSFTKLLFLFRLRRKTLHNINNHLLRLTNKICLRTYITYEIAKVTKEVHKDLI